MIVTDAREDDPRQRQRRPGERARAREQNAFRTVRNAEVGFSRQLRQVARVIGQLARGTFDPEDPERSADRVTEALRHYSQLLGPWARSVAARLVAEVNRRDEKSWKTYSAEMGAQLRAELEGAPLGDVVRQLLNEQAHYIQSIPLDAAHRVQKAALESRITGSRAGALAAAIQTTEHVSRSKANLIARTETAKAASALTMARAEAVGCTHYVWRTMGDTDVRRSHKKMEGRVVAYDTPPEVEPGKRYHAGSFPNCRCYMEPILPREFGEDPDQTGRVTGARQRRWQFRRQAT